MAPAPPSTKCAENTCDVNSSDEASASKKRKSSGPRQYHRKIPHTVMKDRAKNGDPAWPLSMSYSALVLLNDLDIFPSAQDAEPVFNAALRYARREKKRKTLSVDHVTAAFCALRGGNQNEMIKFDAAVERAHLKAAEKNDKAKEKAGSGNKKGAVDEASEEADE